MDLRVLLESPQGNKPLKAEKRPVFLFKFLRGSWELPSFFAGVWIHEPRHVPLGPAAHPPVVHPSLGTHLTQTSLQATPELSLTSPQLSLPLILSKQLT